MNRIVIILCIAVATLCCLTAAHAQKEPADKTEKPAAKTEEPAAKTEKPAAKTEKPAAKTEKPAKPTRVRDTSRRIGTVTLAEVTGSVEVRSAANKPWVKAKVGMKLSSNWEISTGLRGKAVLRFATGSTVVVQRLTEMKISDFSRTKDTVKTRLKMKYGAVRVHVKKGTARNDFKVSCPTATASVKGTLIQEFSYFTGLGGKIVMGPEGIVYYGSGGYVVPLGPGEGTNDKLRDPLAHARLTTWVPVTFSGFTREEKQAALWHGTVGAVIWQNLQPTSTGDGRGPPPPPPENGHQVEPW